MNHKQGYILIELMMYSCLLVFIVIMVMSYATQSHLYMNKQIEDATAYAHMSTVLDRFLCDVSQACADKTGWKLVTDTAHIWRTASGDIGWENTAKGLIRSQGRYDVSTASWTTRDISFFQPGMRYSLALLDETESYIAAVKVTLTRHATAATVSQIRALRCAPCS